MSDRFGTAVRRAVTLCMVEVLGVALRASATLLDRGADLVYDDVLNITWTRNANLPGSSLLGWPEANAWAANLVDCNGRIRSDAMSGGTVDPLHGFG